MRDHEPSSRSTDLVLHQHQRRSQQTAEGLTREQRVRGSSPWRRTVFPGQRAASGLGVAVLEESFRRHLSSLIAGSPRPVAQCVDRPASPATSAARFHGLGGGRWTRDGRTSNIAVAAFAGRDPVGIARLIALGQGRTEIAVDVVDAWHGRGSEPGSSGPSPKAIGPSAAPRSWPTCSPTTSPRGSC